MTETASTVLLWMADNYAIWQPFGLALAVGMLILALTVIWELWSAP